jgi:hypothetical protein
MSAGQTGAAQELQGLYQRTDKRIAERIDWYKKRVFWYRRGNGLVRIGGFLALCVGVAYPAIFPEADFKIPYFAVLAGGLILIADRVFMFSRTWVRYIQAQLGLEATKAELEYDWRRLEGLIVSDSDAYAKWTDVIDILKASVTKAEKIVLDETASWQGELDQALKALSDQIDSTVKATVAARDQATKQLEDKSSSQKAGAINLTVKSAKATLSGVSVSIGKDSRTNISIPAQLSFGGLPPGHQVILAKGTRTDGTEAIVQQAIHIEPGKVAAGNIVFD